MATHSSVLAWRIPWTEESGRLQAMDSQSQTREDGVVTVGLGPRFLLNLVNNV